MSSLFCRHGRFQDRCGICRAEAARAQPKAVTPKGKGTERRRAATSATAPATGARRRGVVTGSLARNADDGFRSELLPGFKSSADVLWLAREVAIGEARLGAIGSPEAGPWSVVAERQGDTDTAFHLALALAASSPDPDAGSDATAEAVLGQFGGTPVHGEIGAGLAAGLRGVIDAGPRGPRAHDASASVFDAPAVLTRRGAITLAEALAGESSWTPERRFARLLDRMSLKGLPRAVRYDLLTVLGRSGVIEVRAGSLHLGADQVTDGAKRLFAVADTTLLERRAAALVDEIGTEWDALEHALWNMAGADATGAGAAARWSTAKPATSLALPGEADPGRVAEIAALLGVSAS